MSASSEFDRVVAEVHVGAPEDFVRRRDALVRELRAAGRREDAAAVKSLRKPSRIAWALNLATYRSPDSMHALDSAVAAMLEAHAVGGDVRNAMATLRNAVRELAARAALGAQDAGHRMDEATFSNAILAVLGNADALAALRRSALAEVPAAGGLDFLSSLPVPSAVPQPMKPKPVAPPQPEPPPQAPMASPEQRAARRASREALRKAQAALVPARRQAEVTQRVLRDVESGLHTKEAALHLLEMEVRSLREHRERARAEWEAAASRLHEAEAALADAEANVARLGSSDD